MKNSLMAVAAATAASALALSLPPARALIEQSMVWHMLVQMPLLVTTGWLGAAAFTGRGGPGWHDARRLNRFGLTGFMLALGAMAYWMIPATIDRAVVLPTADLAKIGSLVIAGVALRQSFGVAPAAVQLFFAGSALPMMVWLGAYMAGTDRRLCNAYSLESQIAAGRGLVLLAMFLGLCWGLALWQRGSGSISNARF